VQGAGGGGGGWSWLSIRAICACRGGGHSLIVVRSGTLAATGMTHAMAARGRLPPSRPPGLGHHSPGQAQAGSDEAGYLCISIR
jgi:hypothetical protein